MSAHFCGSITLLGKCHNHARQCWKANRSFSVSMSCTAVWSSSSNKGIFAYYTLYHAVQRDLCLFQSFLVLSTVLENASEPDLPDSLKDDIALVVVCVDEAKKLIIARCTRKSCSDHCRNLKLRSGQLLGQRSEKCPHIRLSFDHLIGLFPFHQFGTPHRRASVTLCPMHL